MIFIYPLCKSMLIYVNAFNKENSFFQDLKLSIDPSH
jgi:hypothetical protein